MPEAIGYNSSMDMYFHEKWLLDQHKAMVREAEEQSRLEGWEPRGRMSARIAMHLRRLADRIDGPVALTPLRGLGEAPEELGVDLGTPVEGKQSVLLLLDVGELRVAKALDRSPLHDRVDHLAIRS